tara:strand:- start:565 stop:813 length:249 start_codon:yes stop_codon:yes gene_type:complete
MNVTIDISMYPNKDEFIKPIKGFIEFINTYSELKVITFPTSTVIQGEYEYAMNALKETILKANKKYGMAVYVTKIIPNYEAI